MTDTPAIRTEGLAKRYGSKWAVRGLDLTVPQGAVYGLLGVNGAGKSTTLRMLMGMTSPTRGEARVMGRDPERDPVEVKRIVGYVPDAPVLYPRMTVAQVCDFVAYYRRDRWDDVRADALLKAFRLDPRARVRDLSKGQRAKTALLIAMAFRPDLLILDEPTSGLDPVARRGFYEDLLAECQETGRTIIVSSHLVSELAGLVDHVGIIHEGRLALEDTTERLLASMRRFRVAFDGEVPARLGCAGLLKKQVSGREALVTVKTSDPDAARAALEAHSPVSIDEEALGLEDAFIEYVGAIERMGTEAVEGRTA